MQIREQLSTHTVARILSSQELSNCEGTDPHLIKFKELLIRFSKIRVNEVWVKNLSRTDRRFLLRNRKKLLIHCSLIWVENDNFGIISLFQYWIISISHFFAIYFLKLPAYKRRFWKYLILLILFLRWKILTSIFGSFSWDKEFLIPE